MFQHRTLSFAILLVCMLIHAPLVAQITFGSKEELLKAADDFFAKGDHTQAKPLYSQLLSQDPLDPYFNYRYGACIMFTEADPTKPIPFLEGGATTSGVNPEAFYFLGKAYHFNYRFDEAIEAYEKFKKANGKVTGPPVDIDREIQMCVNGRILYSPDRTIKAEEKDAMLAEFYRPYDFRKLKGKVIPTPPNFKTKYDQKNLLGTVIFTPTVSELIFFASYGEDGIYAKDIYMARRLPTGEWGAANRLPNTVNTSFDEDYAFFHDERKTLYFSSKGHNTMGGYDLFASVYDPAAQTWGVPTNLQYPINSPYDDFLYLTDVDESTAFFASTRNSDLGRVKVLRTKIGDPALMDLTVIKGRYDDQADAESNAMQATVVDPETGTVVGIYNASKRTGEYVIILPPKNDYKLTISPKGIADFKFDLDVPLHTDLYPLKQKAEFNALGDNGSVVLTSYFTGAAARDSVVQRQAINSPEMAKIVQSKIEYSPTEQAQAKVETKVNAQQVAEAKARQEAERKAEDAARIALAEARERAHQDSLAVAKKEQERLAVIAAADAKAKAEEQARQQLAEQAKVQARVDSISKIRAIETARFKAKQDSITRMETERIKVEKELAFKRQVAISDSIRQVQEVKLARQRQIEDSLVVDRAKKQVLDQELAAKKKADDEAKAALIAEQKKAEDEAVKAAELAEQQKGEAAAQAALIAEQKKAEAEAVKAAQLAEQQKAEAAAKVALIAEQKKAEAEAAQAAAAMLEQNQKDQAAKAAQLAQQKQAEADALAAKLLEQKQADLARDKQAAEEKAMALAEQAEQAEKKRIEDEHALELQQKAKADKDAQAREQQAATEMAAFKQAEMAAAQQMLAREQAKADSAAAAQALEHDNVTKATKEMEVLWAKEDSLNALAEQQKAELERVIAARNQATADSLALELEGQRMMAEQQQKDAERLMSDQQRAEVEAKAKAAQMAAQEKAQQEADAAADLADQASRKVSKAELKAEVDRQMAEADREKAVKDSIAEVVAAEKAELARVEAVLAAEKAKAEAERLAAEQIQLAEAKRVEDARLKEEAAAQAEADRLAAKAAEQARMEEQAAAEKLMAEAKAAQEKAKAEQAAAAEAERLAAQSASDKMMAEEIKKAEIAEAVQLAEQKKRDQVAELARAAEQQLNDTKAAADAKAALEASRAEAAKQEELRQAQEAIAKAEAIQRELDATHKEVAVPTATTEVETAKPALPTKAATEPQTEADIFKEMLAKLEQERQTKATKPATEPAAPTENVVPVPKERTPTEVADAEMARLRESEKVKDPALQQSVEDDRKAIEEHQALARIKEKELADKLAIDRDLMRSRSISNSDVETPAIAEAPTTPATDKVKEPKIAMATELTPAPVVSEVPVEVEKPKPTEPVAVVENKETAIFPTPAEKVQPAVPKMEQPVAVVKQEEAVAPKVEPVAVVPVEVAQPTSTEEKPAPVAHLEPVKEAVPVVEKVVEVKTAPEPMAHQTETVMDDSDYSIGKLWRMKAAKRHYVWSKMNFDHIADRDVRALVQLLHAQDMGEFSVLRSLRNRAIDTKGDMAKLNELRKNTRAMEVLASMPQVLAREEQAVAMPDLAELHQRKDVSYRINYTFTMPDFSPEVNAAFNAEALAAATPLELNVQSGSYSTMREAKRERHGLSDRGIKVSGLSSLLSGNEVDASTVKDQPFID